LLTIFLFARAAGDDEKSELQNAHFMALVGNKRDFIHL